MSEHVQNSMLRLEMKAMLSRLKALEAKTRASPLPGSSSGNVSTRLRNREEKHRSDHASSRSCNRNKELTPASVHGRLLSRRLRTPSQDRDRSRRVK